MADLSFIDFSDVVDTGTLEAVPAAVYLANIIASELKDTKSGSGKYLQLTWEILEGPFARRKIFERLNVVNGNKTAENIGKSQYSKLCTAAGFPTQQKISTVLHGIPCRIKVVVKTDAQYGDSNEIKNYEAVAGARPGMAAPASAAQPASAAPWARNKAA